MFHSNISQLITPQMGSVVILLMVMKLRRESDKKKNHPGAVTEQVETSPLILSSRSILLASLKTPPVIFTGSSLPTFNKTGNDQAKPAHSYKLAWTNIATVQFEMTT